MNQEQYTNFRQELIQLSKEAVELEGVKEDTAEDLQNFHKRVLQNEFKITLVGAFQGGKSTTFSLACGGRELSPTGIGMKTSACVIEMQNLADETVGEYAEIKWRNSKQLVAVVISCIKEWLILFDKERFSNVINEFDFCNLIDLDNSDDFELFRKAVSAEQKIYNVNTSSYKEGELEVLKIAGIVATHYPVYKEVYNRTRFSLDEVSSYIKFPNKWAERIRGEEFDPNEVYFAFIDRLTFYVRSPFLKRIGSTIIDCPGLFASRYDTRVAQSLINDSNAVIYLLGEPRSIGESDRQALRFIRGLNLRDYLFIAINVREGLRERQRIFEEADRPILEQDGYKIDKNAVSFFNAKLALRIEQYKTLKAGNLPRYDIQSLSEKAFLKFEAGDLPENGKNHLENAHFFIINDIISSYNNYTGKMIQGNDIDKLLQEKHDPSGWFQLFDKVANFIIQRKARSTLIERGAYMALKALSEYEAYLQNLEKAAEEGELEFKKKSDKACDDLESFIMESNGVLYKFEEKLHIPDSKYFNLEQLIKSKDKGFLEKLKHEILGVDEKEFESELNRLLEEPKNEICKKLFLSYKDYLEKRENILKSHIENTIEDFDRRFNRLRLKKKVIRDLTQLTDGNLTIDRFMGRILSTVKEEIPIIVNKKERLIEECQNTIQSHLQESTTQWLEEVLRFEDGQTAEYLSVIIEGLHDNIKKAYKRFQENNKSLGLMADINVVPKNSILENIKFDLKQRLWNKVDYDTVASGLGLGIIGLGLGLALGTLTGGVGIVLAPLITTPLSAVVGLVIADEESTSKAEVWTVFYDYIKSPKFRFSLWTYTETLAYTLRDRMKNSVNESIDDVKKKLEERLKELEAHYKKSQTEKERIAYESNRQRIEIIEPFHDKIKEFTSRVESTL